MPQVRSGAHHDAQVLIEGGQESIEILLEAMQRSIESLGRGQVLEISSSHPDTLAQLPRWCTESHHTLLRIVWTVGGATYWIEKGD